MQDSTMGIWGFEPFDNDTGAGYQARVVVDIKRAFTTDLAKARREQVPNIERKSLAAIAILCSLAKHHGAASQISLEEVSKWQASYLVWLRTAATPIVSREDLS